MNREQTTIRLPAELKEQVQKEADQWARDNSKNYKDINKARNMYIRFALEEIKNPKCASPFAHRLRNQCNTCKQQQTQR